MEKKESERVLTCEHGERRREEKRREKKEDTSVKGEKEKIESE